MLSQHTPNPNNRYITHLYNNGMKIYQSYAFTSIELNELIRLAYRKVITTTSPPHIIKHIEYNDPKNQEEKKLPFSNPTLS